MGVIHWVVRSNQSLPAAERVLNPWKTGAESSLLRCYFFSNYSCCKFETWSI